MDEDVLGRRRIIGSPVEEKVEKVKAPQAPRWRGSRKPQEQELGRACFHHNANVLS